MVYIYIIPYNCSKNCKYLLYRIYKLYNPELEIHPIFIGLYGLFKLHILWDSKKRTSNRSTSLCEWDFRVTQSSSDLNVRKRWNICCVVYMDSYSIQYIYPLVN